MNITNAQFTAEGSITALVDGVQMSIPADAGNRHYAAMIEQGITPAEYVEPAPTGADVNTERTGRLAQGTTIEVTGYGPVAVQGRDQDQITVLALEASARDLTAAGVTDPVIPFRDRDNVQYMLTPEQTMELMRKAKAFAQQIYQASWALKDADPIPLDYADDKHWPTWTQVA